LGEQLERM